MQVRCPSVMCVTTDRMKSLLLLILLVLTAAPSIAAAGTHQIRDVRLWTAPDHTRLVFDLDSPVRYQLFGLHNPERIVIDMNQTHLSTSLKVFPVPDPVIKAIRHGTRKNGALRIVVDLKGRVRSRSFLLKPMHGKPYRLVVDFLRRQSKKTMQSSKLRTHKDIVIAVDAGHGGEDPGAIGPHGIQEKAVTLAVARYLVRALNRKAGIHAALIRKGDYFIPLARRVALARKVHAKLMISIHADAVRNRRVKGASVYMRSERGATDRIAQLLAEKENASDAIGGIIPGEVSDPVVNHILADMIKRDSQNTALSLAEELLKSLHHIGPVKYRQPKKARFIVLGAPEIPSVLVELDYISNPKRERLLRSSKHQKRLARVIGDASERVLRRQGKLPATQAATEGLHLAIDRDLHASES